MISCGTATRGNFNLGFEKGNKIYYLISMIDARRRFTMAGKIYYFERPPLGINSTMAISSEKISLIILNDKAVLVQEFDIVGL